MKQDKPIQETTAEIDARLGVTRDPATGKPRIPFVDDLTAQASALGLDLDAFARLTIAAKAKRIYFHRKLARRLAQKEPPR
jgi:hypothetical protein